MQFILAHRNDVRSSNSSLGIWPENILISYVTPDPTTAFTLIRLPADSPGVSSWHEIHFGVTDEMAVRGYGCQHDFQTSIERWVTLYDGSAPGRQRMDYRRS